MPLQGKQRRNTSLLCVRPSTLSFKKSPKKHISARTRRIEPYNRAFPSLLYLVSLRSCRSQPTTSQIHLESHILSQPQLHPWMILSTGHCLGGYHPRLNSHRYGDRGAIPNLAKAAHGCHLSIRALAMYWRHASSSNVMTCGSRSSHSFFTFNSS